MHPSSGASQQGGGLRLHPALATCRVHYRVGSAGLEAASIDAGGGTTAAAGLASPMWRTPPPPGSATRGRGRHAAAGPYT